MWIPMLIAGAMVVSTCAAGWLGYAKGYQTRSHEVTAQILNSEKQARATEKLLFDRLQEAQSNARKRETQLKRDVDSARAIAGGLRDQLTNATSRLPSASCDSSRQYATTVSELLGECAAAYQGVAEQADRHASDAVMLLEAWPR